jgi:hypothetical protein
VRYQPSLLAIVSSPTREPKIAKILRGRWGRGDPRQVLAQSLLDDLRKSYWQAGAAKRLLFYFPDSAGPLVAKRISALWGYPFRGRDGEDLLCAAVATGNALVRAEWLKLLDTHRPVRGQLAALAATPDDPGDDARERIRTMRAESEELEVVVACVRALPGEPSPRAFAWLKKRLAGVETRDAGWTRAILTALAALDEEASIPIFLAHIEKLQNWGWGNVLAVLQEGSRPKLAVALLREKLDSRDPIDPRPMPTPRGFTEETRWCDLAAMVLAEAKPELAFDPKAPVEERDRQIAAIRAALAK